MKAVLCHMDAYQTKLSVVGMDEFPKNIRIAAVYQATIGPRSFGEGILSRQWQLVQKSHNLQKGGHETSKRWVSRLIQKLWEISWSMWDKRNDEIHKSAKVREKLYSGGIKGKIEALKSQSQFSLCLSKAERDFFATPLEVITKKRERSQLEWIARGEQFLHSTRLSMRLKNSTGTFYRWLARDGEPQHKRQRIMTDHFTITDNTQRETGSQGTPSEEQQRMEVAPLPTLRQTTLDENRQKRQKRHEELT